MATTAAIRKTSSMAKPDSGEREEHRHERRAVPGGNVSGGRNRDSASLVFPGIWVAVPGECRCCTLKRAPQGKLQGRVQGGLVSHVRTGVLRERQCLLLPVLRVFHQHRGGADA